MAYFSKILVEIVFQMIAGPRAGEPLDAVFLGVWGFLKKMAQM